MNVKGNDVIRQFNLGIFEINISTVLNGRMVKSLGMAICRTSGMDSDSYKNPLKKGFFHG